MMTSARLDRFRAQPQDAQRQLSVSTYDRVSGLLLALLIVLGLSVGCMFAIWLSSQVRPFIIQDPILSWEDDSGGGGNQSKELVILDEPTKEEVPNTDDAPVETLVRAVTDAISTQAATLDALSPKSPGSGPTIGTHIGPKPRRTGPSPLAVVPRWERWEVRYSTESFELYARQLDAFGIELGTIGGSSESLEIASGFSQGQPRRSTKLAADEQRLYMTWRDGSLLDADRQLLGQAGIRTESRIVLQLYPREIEDQLARLEEEYAAGRPLQSIKKTVFGVRIAGGRYEFYVVDQRYRLVLHQGSIWPVTVPKPTRYPSA